MVEKGRCFNKKGRIKSPEDARVLLKQFLGETAEVLRVYEGTRS